MWVLAWLISAVGVVWVAVQDVGLAPQGWLALIALASLLLLRFVQPASVLRVLILLLAAFVTLRYLAWRTFYSLPSIELERLRTRPRSVPGRAARHRALFPRPVRQHRADPAPPGPPAGASRELSERRHSDHDLQRERPDSAGDPDGSGSHPLPGQQAQHLPARRWRHG